MNAILGYSELIVEEFGDRIAPSVLADIRTVIGESAVLVSQIDRVMEDPAESAQAGIDSLTARSLEETLSLFQRNEETLTGRIIAWTTSRRTGNCSSDSWNGTGTM